MPSPSRSARKGQPAAVGSNRWNRIQAVCNQIMAGILSGDFPQGSILDPVQLAEQYGTSLATVKDAVRELESKGLLSAVRSKGVQVAEFDKGKYLGVMETVNVLEAAATAFAAPHLTDEDLELALEYNDRMADALEQDDLAAFSTASVDFHRVLFSACPNAYLIDMLDESGAHLAFLRGAMFGFVPMRVQGVIHEHIELIEAIRLNQQPAVIESMMRRHRDATIDVLRTELNL